MPRSTLGRTTIDGKSVAWEIGDNGCFVDGKQVTPEQFQRLVGQFRNTNARYANPGWPIVSTSCAVHPKQVGKYRKFLSQEGADPNTVRPDGKFEFQSHRHRKSILKALRRAGINMSDLDGFN